jgi:peptidoglycan hydrolase-like protein with peptidoglycan-binding domain
VRGDTGEEVVKLQKALLALKLDPGSPDGTFGDQTQAAVISFQSTSGLDPDGVVGDETVRKLNAALKTHGFA